MFSNTKLKLLNRKLNITTYTLAVFTGDKCCWEIYNYLRHFS